MIFIRKFVPSDESHRFLLGVPLSFSSNTLSSMVDISEIALELSRNGLGVSMTCEINGRLEKFHNLHTIPTDLSLVSLSKGLFVPRDAKFIRKLAEFSDNARGYK